MTTWMPMIVGLQLFGTIAVHSAPYVVEGMMLGERIALGTPNYRSYKCKPSEYFQGYTWCDRMQPRSTGGGSLTSTIMHAEDGTSAYLMAKTAPISIDRAAVQKEIDDLPKAMNERPTRV